MSDVLTLGSVDRDGALREALDGLGVDTRSGFLKKAAVGGGAAVAGAGLFAAFPNFALGAPSPAQDVKVLNFALLLEFLESEFYKAARRSNGLTGELSSFASVVGRHEDAHVAFLRGALGSKAIAKPTFDFGDIPSDPTRFATTAQTLEDTGVAAYNGQVANVTKGVLRAAASIVSVEARHASWIRDINATNPAPKGFDDAKTQAQITAAVTATGFIK
ncbi:MAG: ferritin-like domain-containing protein [Actinobacteria bacterium]|nr:ferritin-like domain-containing protein [Actinomycetota bacterium]